MTSQTPQGPRIGQLFDNFSFLDKAKDARTSAASAAATESLEDDDVELLTAGRDARGAGNPGSSRPSSRPDRAGSPVRARPPVIVTDDEDEGGKQPGASPGAGNGEADEADDEDLFDLPVMRRALDMSKALQSAAAEAPTGLDAGSDDTVRVNVTALRDNLGSGMVTMADIIKACGEQLSVLKPYQVVGVSFLTLLLKNDIPGVILADEMGLGKTVQLIAFLGVARELFEERGPHLVICPVSLLDNWEREVQQWCPSMEVRVMYGDKKAQLELDVEEYSAWLEDGGVATGEDPPFDIVLVPYSVFERATSKKDRDLLHSMSWSHVILDEAHAAKNPNSQRTRRIRALSDKCRRRVLVTGTPLQNNLQELQALLELILPEVAGHVAEAAAGDDDDDAVVERLRRVLGSVMLRRLKAEVAQQLTRKEHVVEMLAMGERQAGIYREAVDKLRQRVMRQTEEAAERGGKAGKRKRVDGLDLEDWEGRLREMGGAEVNNVFVHLRKISYHPLLVRSLYPDDRAREVARKARGLGLFGDQATEKMAEEHVLGLKDFEIHSLCLSHPRVLGAYTLDPSSFLESGKVARLVAILDDLRSRGSRPLIFSQWTSMLSIIEAVLNQKGLSYVRLDGSTAGQDRQALCDRFNAPGSDVFAFLLTTRAGGVGLNLTGADTVILHDVDFNPQVDRQAEDRAHRLGQEKPVTVYRLISKGTVDEDIYRISQDKLNLNELVLGDAGREGSASEGRGGRDANSRLIGDILAQLLTRSQD